MVRNKLLNLYDNYAGKQETLLHRAAMHGCYSICQFLINAGSDVTQKNGKNGSRGTAADCARAGGWYHVERLLSLAQFNKNAGNEIQEIADNISKQNGIIDNILNELELIGKQSKEFLLNLCWRIASRDGQDPLQSELWNAIKSQCKDITQNGTKRDWYWLKKCLVPSTVKSLYSLSLNDCV